MTKVVVIMVIARVVASRVTIAEGSLIVATISGGRKGVSSSDVIGVE